MSYVTTKDASGVEKKIDTVQRVDGADTVETAAGILLDQAGNPIDPATQQLQQALNLLVDACRAALATIQDRTPAGGALTNAQLRAAPIQVSQNVALGIGPSDPNIQRVTLATDDPAVNLLQAIEPRIPAQLGGAWPVAPNVARGAGVADGNTQRVVLATDAVSGPMTNAQLRAQVVDVQETSSPFSLLYRILAALLSPSAYDASLDRLRATVALEANQTLGTLTTLQNIASIDGRNASMLLDATDASAWAQCVRACIV